MFPEDLIESGSRFEPPETPQARKQRQRGWPNVVLFLATLVSTTVVGSQMQYNFSHNLPFFEIDRALAMLVSHQQWTLARLAGGLPFSLTLLTILMAHELGHYLACVYYGVDATLPFFIPSPVPVTGTFGAFIRIRSAIPDKKVLFDIGVAGPLAGFVFLLPALGVGLAFSKIVPGIAMQGELRFGAPALQWLASWLIFPHANAPDIYLHPVARAAWVGMFATALNLIPAGQLDGGHLIYALLGRAHRWITWGVIAAMVPMAIWCWTGWGFWAVLLLLFARKHPPVWDPRPVGGGRWQLGFVALLVFILCFSLAPMNQ